MKIIILALVIVFISFSASASEFYDNFLNKLTTIKTYSINSYICGNINYSSGKDLKKMYCVGNGKCLLNEKNNYSIKELYSSLEKGTRSDYFIFYKINENGNEVSYAWIGTAYKEQYLLPDKFGVLEGAVEIPIPVIWEEKVINNQKWFRLPSFNESGPLWVKDDEKVKCKNEIRDYMSSERVENFNSYALRIKLHSGNLEIITTDRNEELNVKNLQFNHNSIGKLGWSLLIFIEKIDKGILFFKILDRTEGKCNINEENFKVEFNKGTLFKIPLNKMLDRNGFFSINYIHNEFSFACFLEVNKKDFQKEERGK